MPLFWIRGNDSKVFHRTLEEVRASIQKKAGAHLTLVFDKGMNSEAISHPPMTISISTTSTYFTEELVQVDLSQP